MSKLHTRIVTAAALMMGLLALLSVGGCGGHTYTDYSAFVSMPRPVVSGETYKLAPPDRIRLRSKRLREVDGHMEMIRPDGKIVLPLLGPIFVAGKTCEEVAEEIKALSSQYYENADVTVHVTEYASQRIYVFGEVSRPGPYPYTGRNTVMSLMASSQPTRLANPARVQVLRPNSDGRLVKRMTVDLNKMVKEGDTTLNAYLRDGDVIYVPPNGFAKVGLALQQVLLPIRPMAETVRGPATVDDAAGEY